MADDNNDSDSKTRHPPSRFKAEYPMNRVTVTESGHEIHFDDTKDRERIRIAHKSGSYMEFGPDGRHVQMHVSDSVAYHKGGHTITSDKNVDHKYHGSVRTSVHGDTHSEAKGDVSSAVGGDHKSMVGGSSSSAVKGDHTHGVVGKTTFKMGKGIQLKGDSTLQGKFDGKSSLEFGSNFDLSSKGDMSQKTEAKLNVESQGDMSTKSGGQMNVEASGNMNLKSAKFAFTGGGNLG